MLLLKPSYRIISNIDAKQILSTIEFAARLCYKTEDKMTETSADALLRNCIAKGHESILEHATVSVHIVCDRGISHELVRHRIASFSQESTRYVNYSGSGVCFIIPSWIDIEPGSYDRYTRFSDQDVQIWFNACLVIESTYIGLCHYKWRPEHARSVLPNSLKTELVMTANLREWRHFFKLRALGRTGKPHPQMLELAVPMLAEFKERIPVIFDDLT